MNVVGNYELVLQICRALQAGRTVVAGLLRVRPDSRRGRFEVRLFSPSPYTMTACFLQDADAYEAATEFVRRVVKGSNIEMPR